MNEDDAVIWALAWNCALLSLIAVGGVNVVLPEVHRVSVEVYGWMSSEDFTDLFAIAQACPGPNIIVLGLIGSHVAGVAGASVATLAILAPSSVLVFWTSRLWERYRTTRWRIAVQNGLVPIALGLVGASAWLIARAADKSIAAVVITVATALILYFTRIHPIWTIAAGAGIGLTGIV